MGRVLFFLTLATTLPHSIASFAQPPTDSTPITWTRLHLVSVAPQSPATTDDLELDPEIPARIGIVLEGTRSQMPVYCSPFPKVRLAGRAIPERMIVRPDEVGLAVANIQWNVLRPGRALATWERMRYAEGDGQWTLELLELPGKTGPGVSSSWGTVRFAAALRAPRPGGGFTTIESSGWSRTTTRLDLETGPGIRVTRSGGYSLAGFAYALARIPFVESAPADYARRRIAMQSIDLPLGAVECYGRCRLPGDRTRLPNPEWEWLFRTVHRDVRRRGVAGAPLVDSRGRAIPISRVASDSSSQAKLGDILVSDGRYSILEADDGDGWLGEGDKVIHSVHGEVEGGRLADFPGKTIDVLRMRDFMRVRDLLIRAGYGNLGRPTPAPSPELFRACTEFQRDHSLAVTGLPDSTTTAAIRDFVERLAAADSATVPAR